MLSQFEYLDSSALVTVPAPAGSDVAGRAVAHDTVLYGTVPDQAALHGVLRQVGALGLDLVELRCPHAPDPSAGG